MAKDNELIHESLSDIRKSLSEIDDKVHTVDKSLTEYKVTFDHHQKQDEKMYDELVRMNNILAENTNSLKVHMKRTSQLEDAFLKMDSRLAPIELERIKKQAINKWLIDKAILAAKIVGGIATLLGTLYALR